MVSLPEGPAGLFCPRRAGLDCVKTSAEPGTTGRQKLDAVAGPPSQGPRAIFAVYYVHENGCLQSANGLFRYLRMVELLSRTFVNSFIVNFGLVLR